MSMMLGERTRRRLHVTPVLEETTTMQTIAIAEKMRERVSRTRTRGLFSRTSSRLVVEQ